MLVVDLRTFFCNSMTLSFRYVDPWALRLGLGFGLMVVLCGFSLFRLMQLLFCWQKV